MDNNIFHFNESNSLQKIKNIKTSNNYLILKIEKTTYIEVYKLYINNELHGDKYVCNAYVPTIAHSRFLTELFDNNMIDTKLLVKCVYAIDYNKWIPFDIAINESISNNTELSNYI